ncbi:MAG: hypothetical protein GXO39_09625 [Thermotogae bacterium]|nr:hypothetical protein [Thermotogota bacterium]
MKRLVIVLLLSLALGCRYRFTPGIYIPLQVGTLYRYTSRYVTNDLYESPKGKYYTPDSLLILADTNVGDFPARKVFVKKQYACKEGLVCNPKDPNPDCYCVADTSIYALINDTLVLFTSLEVLVPPKFAVMLGSRPHFVELSPNEGKVKAPMLYLYANPGTSWKVLEGHASVKLYPVEYDTATDSVREFEVRYSVEAQVLGFEDVTTSYRPFRACAKVGYYLSLNSDEFPTVSLHAMDMWWCDGVGQVRYLYTPEAATYKDRKLTYADLSFVEEGR